MNAISKLAPEALGPTITIGEILVEIMGVTTGVGFREAQPLVGPFPSGAPAIFIDQVAKLGGACGIVSAVGDDDFGWLNIERLKTDGVDVSAIDVLADMPTGSAFVRYRPDGARDFVFNIARSASAGTRMTAAAKALINRAGHVHVMGSAFAIPGIAPIILDAVSVVKARGGSVSFDPNVRKELMSEGGEAAAQLHDILAVTDLLLPSGDELFIAAGIEGQDAAIEALLSRGISEIVLKRGRDGSTHLSRGHGKVDCPAFVVDELDPTGAGDCFGATYLTCRRKGHFPADALRYANAAGARTVTRQGPMEGTSTFAELHDFISASQTRI